MDKFTEQLIQHLLTVTAASIAAVAAVACAAIISLVIKELNK
jgi:hypothetical protein